MPEVVMPMELAGMVEAIGITASTDRPVNLTVLAIARSRVRADPARYGVPASETRASSPSPQSTAPIAYRPGAQPAAAGAPGARAVPSAPFGRALVFTAQGGRAW